MNLNNKNDDEFANDISNLALMHAGCASHILKESDTSPNIALYHLSVIVKVSAIVLCRKHNILFSDSDSIELLLNKTYHVLPSYIASISKEISFWYNDLPFEYVSIMTDDEALDVGRKIQTFYNSIVVVYLRELGSAEVSYADTSKIEIF